MTTIKQIKKALDMGLTVTLAKNGAYTVIKSNGQYLIQYSGYPQSWLGLHGLPGTKYENQINMTGDWIVSGTIKGETP